MAFLTVPVFTASLFFAAFLYIERSSKMLKRLSSTFKKGWSKEEEPVNGLHLPQKPGPDRAARSPELERKETENIHHAVK